MDEKIGNLERKRDDSYLRGNGYSFDASNYYNNGAGDRKRYKQKWMKAHGNEGLRPEEKYKAGRYLKAYQAAKSEK